MNVKNVGECGIKQKKTADGQKTIFDSLIADERDKKLNNLSPVELGVGRGLIDGKYQALIARDLGCPKASVNRIVKMFERIGLVEGRTKSYSFKGKKYTISFDDILDNRRKVYVVSPLLEAAIEKAEFEAEGDCMCRVHNVGLKTSVIRINGESSKKKSLSELVVRHLPLTNPINRYITFVRTFTPLGPDRHVFSVETSSITCTIVVHGNTVTAQWATGATVRANDPISALESVKEQVKEALSMFMASQRELGVRIEHTCPQLFTQPHFASPSFFAKQIQESGDQLQIGGIQVDGSPMQKGLNFGDIEIHGDEHLAQKVDQGLKNALMIESIIDEKLKNYSAESDVDEGALKLISGGVAEITTSVSKEFDAMISQKLKPLIDDVESMKSALTVLPSAIKELLKDALRDAPVSLDGTLSPWMRPKPRAGSVYGDMSELKITVRDLRLQLLGISNIVTELLGIYRETQARTGV